MWTREQIKQKAKEGLKLNQLKAIIVSVLVLAFGIGSGVNFEFPIENTQDSMYEENMFPDNDFNDYYENIYGDHFNNNDSYGNDIFDDSDYVIDEDFTM